MKKLASVILAAILTLSLLPALAEEADFLGTWYLTVEQMGETQISAADLGLEISAEVAADGTIVLSTNFTEETEEATWRREDGQILVTLDGVDLTVTLADGQLELTGEVEGSAVTLIFSRTAPELATAPEGEEIAIESLEALEGSWTGLGVSLDGIYHSIDFFAQYGFTFSIDISDGACVLTAYGFAGEPQAPTLEDGKATLEDGSVIALIEGDILVLTYPEELGGTVIYFTRVQP